MTSSKLFEIFDELVTSFSLKESVGVRLLLWYYILMIFYLLVMMLGYYMKQSKILYKTLKRLK